MAGSPNELIQEQRRLEHLKEVSAFAEADSRVVHVRVTASLGLGVLYLTQLPFARLVALSVGFKICLVSGLLALVGSALAYFEYSTHAHLARLVVATRILDGNAADATTWWNTDPEGPWKKRKWWFRAGNVLLGLGVLLLIVVLADLFGVI